MSRIGFQNGVAAARERMRRIDPAGFRTDGTGAWDKFFRTIEHLVVEHDAEAPPPPPPPPPPPAFKRVAPKTANKEGSSDARFCCLNQPGVVWMPNHPLGPCFVDEVARYDENGLHLGGRSFACTEAWHDGLTGAKSMDGRDPCELSPVGDPTKNTGSWTL